MYTNDSHSKYKALVVSLNGNVRQSDLLTASVTIADKKNISDDFSPTSRPVIRTILRNMEAEYGRARGAERYRIVLSGIFHMPMGFLLSPIYEYGSGQPWTHRLGYDFNGDGKNSDRPSGIGRFTMDGPPRPKASSSADWGQVEAIAEGFNITNVTNYDVQSMPL